MDGAVVQQISGNVTWAQVSYALPAGQHTVEWRYEKDASISALGEGLFVDEIALIPPVGDAERHIDARVRTASLSGSTLVFNEPGAVDRFKARAVVDVQRLDEVTLPLSVVATAVLPVKIAWSLDDMHTGAPVAVENGEHLFSVSLATHLRFNALPAVAVLDETFSVGGAAPLDINPAWFYRLTLNVSYTDENDNPVAIGTSQLNNLRLVTFSGRFTAGPVEARFISTDWSSAGVVASGDGLGHTFTVFSAPNTAYFVDNPASRFSFNFNTVYRELSTGDLTLRPGSTIPLPQFGGTVANVCYRIENSTLSSTGLSGGSMKVCLPAGTGVTASATARLLESEINFGVVPITSAGLPNFASRTTASPLYLVHEQTPVRYAGPVTWDVAAGTFTMPPAPASYVRKREMEWLAADAAAGLLTVPSAAVKDSNEAPWQRAGGTVGDVVITAAAGGVGVLTASVSLGGPDKTVKLHHPAGVSLPLTGASMISVVNGAFTADSMLNLSGPVAVSYSRDGFDAGECNVTAAGAGTLSMGAANDALNMTSDGGWRAAGTLPAGARIDWGGLHGALPTHRLENAGAVTLLVSGTYLDGNYAAVPEPSRAAALLLSGLGTPEDYTLVERPFTAEFEQGLVDYPGLNVRVSGGVPAASSFLAGHALGPYSLKPYSKYYVTSAGVSGIHDAVTSTLPAPIQLYGYDSMLDGLRLSYLDSQNKESATGGSITLPVPSGFFGGLQRVDVHQRRSAQGGHAAAQFAAGHAGLLAMHLPAGPAGVHPAGPGCLHADEHRLPDAERAGRAGNDQRHAGAGRSRLPP